MKGTLFLLGMVMALVIVAVVYVVQLPTTKDPKAVEELTGWVESLRSKNEPHYTSAARTPPLVAMRKTAGILWKLCQQEDETSTSGTAEPNERIRELVETIMLRWVEITNAEYVLEKDAREARLIAMRAQFVGAQNWPDQFEEVFLTTAETVAKESPGTADAAWADTLMLLYQHDLGKPTGPEFLRAVDEFTRSYGSSPVVIRLYKTASVQLVKNGQKDSARALLKHGLEVFEDRPQVWQLVDILVKKGLAPPPPPRITKTSWKAYVRSLDGRGGE